MNTERIANLSNKLLNQAGKSLDVTLVHVAVLITNSELETLTDEQIARRYFDPMCRELEDQVIGLRSKAHTVRVETEEVEDGLYIWVEADLDCPHDREFDPDAWRELEE